MPEQPVAKPNGLLNLEINIGGINLQKKAIFAKNLSVLIKAGLTITESLYIVRQQTTGKMGKVIDSIILSVESGNSLSEALSRHPKVFSSLFIKTTMAGETSGTLDTNLENVANKMKKDQEFVAKLKGAMIYPSIVLAGALALSMAISFLVLPKITPLFSGLGVDLPLATRFLINFSNFIQVHKTILLVSIFSLIFLFSWTVKQKFAKPYVDYVLLKIPLIKDIIKNANLSTFSRTLGMLLKSGLNIDEALNISKDTVGNYYYRRALEQVSAQVSQGAKLSDNLLKHQNLFPKMVSSMVMVGESSGNLQDSLLYLSDIYEEEVELATKSLTTAIEPMLLIFIGVMVGGLAISIIMPIYEITGKVQ
jgi:type IV pilus assembly protein PilC